MKLTIEIEMNNSAFDVEDAAGSFVEQVANASEVNRILTVMTHYLEDQGILSAGVEKIFRDINGNKVAQLTISND